MQKVISHLEPESCLPDINSYRVIDVRRPEEYMGELGHIQSAELITIDESFPDKLDKIDRSEKILFVCRSGQRSGKASEFAMAMGFKDVHNMAGGMIRWNDLKYPITK